MKKERFSFNVLVSVDNHHRLPRKTVIQLRQVMSFCLDSYESPFELFRTFGGDPIPSRLLSKPLSPLIESVCSSTPKSRFCSVIQAKNERSKLSVYPVPIKAYQIEFV